MTAQYTKIASLKELTPYERWQSEIEAAEKELQKWHRSARRIVKSFRAEKSDASLVDVNFERRFNIFTANVQLMQAALLNETPLPYAEREFKDSMDDAARVAARILERALTQHARHSTLMYDILTNVVQDNLVPGVGINWHTYKAEISEKEDEGVEYEEVESEELVDEYVYWEDLLWSPCRVWEENRWLARKTYLTRDQLTERFGEEIGKEIALDYSPKKNDTRVETQNQVFQQACIYEIWCKEDEKVYWFSKGYDKILDTKDDFLDLEGFYPCPKPLFATVSNGQLIPIPDYEFARDQYRELNEINTRISLLVRACRVAGVYDKSAGAVTSVLSNAAENVLVPVDSWAAFAEKGGLKGVIDWIPLDQVVKTMEQLYKGREDVKTQIYEVTGMSDILRGASKASETLGAQKIKAQYASMRIQLRQKAVAIYASGIFSIQAELMRKHMDPMKISDLASAELMGEDPQLIAQALQLLKSPDFDIRLQVESDTLSDIDFQAEKQERMDYMQAVSMFLKEANPMMGDPIMGPFMMSLLQFSLAGFKVGKKFEGQLDRTFQQMQQKLANPQPPQPTLDQQKVQAEMQLMQAEGQQKAQEGQMDMQLKQLDVQAKQMDMQMKRQSTQMDMQSKAQELGMKTQAQQQDAMFKAQGQQMDMRARIADATIKAQTQQQDAQLRAKAQAQDAQVKLVGSAMDLQAKGMQHHQNMMQSAQKAKQAQLQAAQKAGPGKPPVQ